MKTDGLFERLIHRPVLATMLNLALVVFGVIGLTRLPVRELPNIDPPVVTVLTVYPGASADVVETEVTERLEEAVSSAERIKRVTSESREQVSSITLEFTQGWDVDIAAQDVRDRVARVRGLLPEDIDEPIISKQDASAQPFIWIALYSDNHSTLELTEMADERIKDRLQTVEGVSAVIFGGEKRFAIRLWLDAERMAARGLTVMDVQAALRQQNVELPSGRVENTDREFTIQTRGQLKDLGAFNQLVIKADGNQVTRFSDIGVAEVGVEDERSIARYNGKPAVGLGVIRQSKSNAIQVADGVKKELDRIGQFLPAGVACFIAYDESIFVEKAVVEVWETLALALVLVLLTIFLFLRNFRSTIVPAMAIPVSVIATFGVMYVLGYSVNIFTLLAMVLAIGIVVDDAIVVLENIYRHMEDGHSPLQAAKLTMREIAFAIVAITLSLVAVFTPLLFLEGITGRLLLEFSVSFAVAVLISAFVALTLTPMASARVLKPVADQKHGRLFLFFERVFDRLTQFYTRALSWSLRHRLWVVALALLSLLGSWWLFKSLEREFIPEEDKGFLMAFIMSPVGSTSEYSDRMMRKAEVIVKDEPSVAGFFSAVALPFNGPGDASFGIMFAMLQQEDRKHIRDIVYAPNGVGSRLFNEVEGALAFAIMPKAVDVGFGQPFQLVIQGDDLDQLNDFAAQFAGRLQAEGFLENVRSNFEITKPELNIEVDRDRAAALGVSIEDISRTLQVLFGGLDVSRLKRGGKEYDVIAQLKRDHRLTPQDLQRLYVPSAQGPLVQLSNLVQVNEGAAANAIYRYQRIRSATIEGTPKGIPLGTAVEKTEALLQGALPAGFDYDWAGEADNLRESESQILFFLILAIVAVYMVLAAQFESLIHPFTVMLALPLAGFGAFGSLWALSWVDRWLVGMQGESGGLLGWLAEHVSRIPSMNLNIFSQVGLILLVGLVTKNAILLVEFANQAQARGANPVNAMLEAGRIRFRPILMTSLATIAGILPIALGFGDAAESRRPLGVVAVGGLITSTVLTLFVIPVMYTVLARFTKQKEKLDMKPGEATVTAP
ncbi:MAG: efflux RND transporter permease subunit [Acidobacteria bacterium]|nr:efflux RND transporter permease subunit [Acidobacteriota bacterium]